VAAWEASRQDWETAVTGLAATVAAATATVVVVAVAAQRMKTSSR